MFINKFHQFILNYKNYVQYFGGKNIRQNVLLVNED